MARDIIITPKNQEPQIQFTGSGDVSSINLNVGSGISPVSGIREAGSGITTLSFEGTQGQLFSITDNLSSGTIFSVADITGLPLLEVDASGAVKIAEYGISTTVGQTTPKYNFDVAGTGGFESVVSDKFEIYASGDALSAGQEKLIIHDNNGTFEVRASGQGGGSINNFKIVSDKAAVSAEENYITIDGQKTGDNMICRLRLNGSNRFKFYNEGFAPEASSRALGGSSTSARWKGIWGQYLDVNGFNSTTTTLAVGSSASQSANIAEFKASDDVVIAKVEPDGSIATSGDVKVSGDILFQDGSYLTTTTSATASELRYYGSYFWIRGGSHGISLNVVNSVQGGANISTGHSFSWSAGAITGPTVSADTHLIRVDANKVGIKSTFKNSAGDYGELIASGVSLSGVYLANHVPQDTANMLYNNAGTLTFNGSAVGGGGGSVTGTPSGVAFFGADESLTTSSQMFYNSGTNVLTLKSDNPQIEFRGADDNLALKIGDSQSNTNEGAYIGFYWQDTNNSYFDTTSGKTRFRVANGDLWFRNNSNADIAKMEGGTTDPLWSLYPQGTAQVGQIIKGQAAHSANLSEWHASDDVVIAQVEPDGSIASSGDISSSGTIAAGDLLVNVGGSQRVYNLGTEGDANTEYLETVVDGGIYCIRTGATGTGASIKKVYVGTGFGGTNVSRGITVSNSDAKFNFGGARFTIAGGAITSYAKLIPATNGSYACGEDGKRWSSVFSEDGNFSGSVSGARGFFEASTTTDPTLTVTSAASQTANLQEWLANDDVVIAQVEPDGSIATSGDVGVSGDILCHGELKTATIGYTDGDNAMTIADGGKVTFAAGFAVGSDAEGDMLYHNGTSYVRLAKGTDDYVLKMNGNVPNWEAGGGSSTLAGLTDTNISSPANGHILIYDNATSKWDNALLTSTGGTISFTFGAGTINLEAGVGPSDERLKENVKSIEDSLDKILAMNPVEFEWRDGQEDIHNNSGKDIGFIAQEIEKIQPELVGEHKDFKTLDYEKFSPLIVGAIQELSEQIQEVKDLINKLN